MRNVSKETCNVSKETCNVSKETCNVSKETCNVSKETCNVSKETCRYGKSLTNTTKETYGYRIFEVPVGRQGRPICRAKETYL